MPASSCHPVTHKARCGRTHQWVRTLVQRFCATDDRRGVLRPNHRSSVAWRVQSSLNPLPEMLGTRVRFRHMECLPPLLNHVAANAPVVGNGFHRLGFDCSDEVPKENDGTCLIVSGPRDGSIRPGADSEKTPHFANKPPVARHPRRRIRPEKQLEMPDILLAGHYERGCTGNP